MKSRRNSTDAKEYILNVAEQSLIENGVNGLKISQLAERAHMRHANIIYHFGSIEGVRKALMARLISRNISEIMDIAKEVEDKSIEEALSIPAEMVERLFDQFSKPYMLALFGWKLSHSPGEPIQEMEMMIEGFVHLTSTKLTELGQVKQARRENILTIIHMGLSVCIGSMFLNSILTKSQTSPEINKKIKSWVIQSVTDMSVITELGDD